MWSNCFCFVLLHLASYLARQPVFQNKICFGNFIYVLPRDVNKPQNGLFQKKIKQGLGGQDILLWKLHQKWYFSFFYLLYPWKFQTKQGSTPGYSTKLCQIPQKDPQKSHIIFSWSTLEIPLRFYLTPRNSTCYYFDTPGNSISSIPLFGFFLEQPKQLLLMLHLALFYYLSIIIADQTCYSIGRQGELLVKLIFSDLTSSQQSVCRQSRHQVIQMMCAMFATCLGILFLTE